MGDFVRKIDGLGEGYLEKINEECEDLDESNKILHTAVGIRRDIEKLDAAIDYPNAHEVDIDPSAAFVPDSLQNVFQCLLDKHAFNSADQDFKSSNETRRRYSIHHTS